MEVTLKFFALGRDLVGTDELVWQLPENSTVQTLVDRLNSEYPDFAALKTYMVAVNMEYSDKTVAINDGDEIAIIPPVSGG